MPGGQTVRWVLDLVLQAAKGGQEAEVGLDGRHVDQWG
jgi:hypothetical protein